MADLIIHFQPKLIRLTSRGLLSCVRHCADLVPTTDIQFPMQKCFKSLEYISKFVIQSRFLFTRATSDQNDDSFRVDIHLMFNSINKMLSSTNGNIVQTQTVLLHHIGSVYPHFLRVLPVIDMAKLTALM